MTPFRILPDLKVEQLINDEWRRCGQARHTQLYTLLGVEGSRLPEAGIPPHKLVNVWVWVLPKTIRPQDAARMWCECPHCGRHLTTGKLQQHLKVHKDSSNG